MQGTWVRSLVGELRSQMPLSNPASTPQADCWALGPVLCNKRSPHIVTKTQHSQKKKKKSEHDNWIHEGKQNLNHTWYNLSFSALCCCLVAQSCPDSCDPMDCSLPGSSVPGISQARVLEWAAVSFSGDLLNPGMELASTALAGGFFTTEPPGSSLLE